MSNYNLENKIQETFLKLVKKYSLEEIDVSKICSSLKITRQSFYYHYKNIYDLIFAIYINKKLVASNLASLKEIVLDLLDFLYKDEFFNKEVAESNVSSVLKEYCFSYLFQSLSLYLIKFENIDSYINRKISKFYALSISEEILDLFINPDYDKLTILNEVLVYLNDEIIKNIGINFKKIS